MAVFDNCGDDDTVFEVHLYESRSIRSARSICR